MSPRICLVPAKILAGKAGERSTPIFRPARIQTTYVVLCLPENAKIKKKKCSNPLHGEWNNESNALKLVNLRACGLADLFNAFKKVIAARGMRFDRVGRSICSFCLGKFWKKREFTRHLTDLQRPVVEEKVGNLTETSFLFSK